MLFDYTGNIADETVQRKQLHRCINIYLHRECRKTGISERLFYFDRGKLNLTGGFFIFLLMVTGREIIFICSTDLGKMISLISSTLFLLFMNVLWNFTRYV